MTLIRGWSAVRPTHRLASVRMNSQNARQMIGAGSFRTVPVIESALTEGIASPHD
jgi:hypothetical protein